MIRTSDCIILSKYDLDGEVSLMKVVPGCLTWPEAFEEFRSFLNGCGYEVPIGDWVEDSDDV